MAADADAGTLCAVHHDCGIPADESAEAAFDFFVTGEPGFALGGNGVDVVGGGEGWDRDPLLPGALEQAKHQVPGPAGSGVLEKTVEGLQPFSGLIRVDVREVGRDSLSDDANPLLVLRCFRAVSHYAGLLLESSGRVTARNQMWRWTLVRSSAFSQSCRM